MKLKLELANVNRERLKEQAAFEKGALQRKEHEAVLKEREATLERERQKAVLLFKEREAALERERQKEQAALQREQGEFQCEREREQLKVKERDLEIQREHSKKQADSALEYRRKELDLETTHLTRRQ
ncbi:putative uncharacterized protein DDB_G0271982 [Procambarus clarkii]|uniref:putative uncharacterized protein DDB_G0271982 n=1 Tax=Procambarus clarkii TaxID=6728 RepID=UPI003744A2C6